MREVVAMVTAPDAHLLVDVTVLPAKRPRVRLIVHVVVMVDLPAPTDGDLEHEVDVVQGTVYRVADMDFEVVLARNVEGAAA